MLLSALSFSLDHRYTHRYRHLPHDSPLTTALWHRNSLYTLPSRTDPYYHQPLRASPRDRGLLSRTTFEFTYLQLYSRSQQLISINRTNDTRATALDTSRR